MGKKKAEKHETAKLGVTKLSSKKAVAAEDVLKEMKRLAANGIVEFTSTLLRDKLGLDKESGKDQVRRVMKKLEAEGKVEIDTKQKGKRKTYIYTLKQ